MSLKVDNAFRTHANGNYEFVIDNFQIGERKLIWL